MYSTISVNLDNSFCCIQSHFWLSGKGHLNTFILLEFMYVTVVYKGT